jgi:L-alanine-DL-glutamate epimerase-like enolase superfamily enzyme
MLTSPPPNNKPAPHRFAGAAAAGSATVRRIRRVELRQVDLEPKVVRTDAIQAFVRQETLLVTVVDDEERTGTGYAYTIGTGGSSVLALLHDHLVPRLLGRDPIAVEAIWKDLFFHTHATAVGAITSLALAAIDTALWDWRARALSLPLWQLLGGAQPRVPVYTTEGGWLHLDPAQLIEQTAAAKAAGFRGAKIKVGRPHLSEDVARLAAVRNAVGNGFELMTDANQGFTRDEARRRAAAFSSVGLAWLEEPLPAEDIEGHVELARSTAIPVAIGESLYHPAQFREYLARGACSIVQADVARIGGITPWLKVAHLAETFNVPICPHFLMELHVSLCAGVPNARWVEFIPQLDDITESRVQIEAGYAVAPAGVGLGIEWNWDAIGRRQKASLTVSEAR